MSHNVKAPAPRVGTRVVTREGGGAALGDWRSGLRGEAVGDLRRNRRFDGTPRQGTELLGPHGHVEQGRARDFKQPRRMTAAETAARPVGVMVVGGSGGRLGGGPGVVARVGVFDRRRVVPVPREPRRLDRAGMEQRQDLAPHRWRQQGEEGGEPAETAERGDHGAEATGSRANSGGGRRSRRSQSSTTSTSANATGVEVSSFTSQR